MPPIWDSWVFIQRNMAWAEVYLHAKSHLDHPVVWPQNAPIFGPCVLWPTTHMGRKWGLCPFLKELGPHLA